MPPVRTKALHSDPSCADWRALWQPAWEGDDDRRRRLAKIMRYATLLGKDEKSAATAKDIEKENLTRKEVIDYAKQYLDSKPYLVAAKRRIWEKCATTGEARTFMGRRRRLFGDWWDRAKEGWSHMLQGAEVDMMCTCLIAAHQMDPDVWLVLNSHDGATLGYPDNRDPKAVKAQLSEVVEQTWQIEGVGIKTSADFKLWHPDGRIEKLK